ncbi:MAG: hypothetical protein RSC73_00930 [Ruthenibacterium sp.]
MTIEEKAIPSTEETQTAPPAAPEADSDLPKTQEELDALVEKRVARERKKFAKQMPPAAQAVPPADPQAAQATLPPAAADTTELDAVHRNLMIANAQLTAIKNGVAPGAVEDAVYLAMMHAEKAGEADEDGIADALKEVLKRRPEWKTQSKNEDAKSGFKIGVNTTDSKDVGQKKALPTGRVMF